MSGKVGRFLQVALTMAFWFGSLFLGAGTIHWTRGWISVAVLSVGLAGIGIAMQRGNPGLMAERSKWKRKDTKSFDHIFLAAMFPLSMGQPAVAGMDAVRFSWLPIASIWVWPALPLYFAGAFLIGWTLAVNRHAESTVRIQKDRDHQVVTTGPYRLVRHPMYLGILLTYIAVPLLWGSGVAMAMSVALIALYFWRTYMEDRTLHNELPGYPEFAKQTAYRLIPGVW